MKRIVVLAAVVGWSLFYSDLAFSQSNRGLSELKREIEALKAAEAASCSGEQGKYWEMHDRLFANQNALAAEQLAGHAEAVGLDAGKFKTCLESGKYAAKVRKDLTDAQKAGVTGTPTFFIGLTDSKGSEIKAVRKIVGAQNYAAFRDAIESLLAAQ